MELLRPIAPTVDAVLISHASPKYLGLLPLAMSRLGLACPVYSTTPSHRMGQVCMYEAWVASRRSGGDAGGLSLEDLDACFSRFEQVHYEQPLLLDKGKGITAEAHASGHMIGGAVWCVSLMGEDVVYAPSFSHRGGLLLGGAALEAVSHRPSAVIVGCPLGVVPRPPQGSQTWEKALLDAVMATLRKDGDVLIPCDAAGRALEVLALLDDHWRGRRLEGNYSLVFLSHTCKIAMDFAATQLEWVRQDRVEGAAREGDGQGGQAGRGSRGWRDNPMSFKCVQLASTVDEALGSGPGSRGRAGPRVVVATQEDLEGGMAQELLWRWGRNRRNLVALTGVARKGTQAAQLQTAGEYGGSVTLSVSLPRPGGAEGAEAAAAGATEAGAQAGAGGAAVKEEGDVDMAGPREGGEGGSQGPPEEGEGTAVDDDMELGGDAEELEAATPGTGRPRTGYVEEWGCVVDGFECPADAVGPMYPAPAVRTQERSAYGEEVGVGEFAMLKTRNLAGRAAGREGATEDQALSQEVQLTTLRRVLEGTEQFPATETKQVAVQARVGYFDLAGLSDQDSVARVVARMAPRLVLVTHGEPGVVRELCQSLENALAGAMTEVRAPGRGEWVDVHPGACAMLVDLERTALGPLVLHDVGNYEVGYLSGTMGAPGGESEVPQVLGKQGGAELDEDDGGAGVFIGDVQLTELRGALASRGIRAAFGIGEKKTLVCDGRVVVRRAEDSSGTLVVEGPLSEMFYRIREVVYSQYSIC